MIRSALIPSFRTFGTPSRVCWMINRASTFRISSARLSLSVVSATSRPAGGAWSVPSCVIVPSPGPPDTPDRCGRQSTRWPWFV